MRIHVSGKMPDEWMNEKLAALEEYLEGESVPIEQWAKANASTDGAHIQADGRTKWTNQTGDARDFLTGDGGKKSENRYFVSISQGKKYGYYLETAHDGKYAICKPALNHFIPIINSMIKTIFNGKDIDSR
ncbi:hypothetical protein FACS1894151_08160 [Spirochaetia bacterium]|nr:hypothetical protein FACS1894151_08160 [Spirochaetia bacterium]